MSLVTILGLFISAALGTMALIALANTAYFPRLGRVRDGHHVRAGQESGRRQLPSPRLSVLIPARNESRNIPRTVTSLLAQDYPNLEIWLLDDGSTDGTADLALTTAQGDPRLQVAAGQPLPEGWLGKSWACHQLSRLASGDIWVFADADVTWGPRSLVALVAEMATTDADLLTVWPTQETTTWGERLVVPLMALVVQGYLPWLAVHHLPWPMFAAANGQCLAFRPAAYRQVGGHSALRSNIVEDVAFARLTKSAGLRLRMADGAGLISCRMYESWPAVRQGYAKNILAGYGGRISALALASLFHWLVFLWPWAWLAGGAVASMVVWAEPLRLGWPWWPVALIGAGIGLRALTAALTRQRVGDALLLPISVLMMTIIAGQSTWWKWRHGGPHWKGRVYRRE